jgi:hypothetical protein
MARSRHIDDLLRSWKYEPGEVRVRMVRGSDGRQVVQMRVELGILQLEVDHRPDGQRPGGADTYLDWMHQQAFHAGEGFVLSEEQCDEIDREFLQFYHRRVCWLALREFRRAVADADHTLALMDFVKRHSPSEEWTLAHEQYRPFVLFHRTQAAALNALENAGPEEAITAINDGLQRMREFFAEHDAEDRFEDDEMVLRLRELQDSLRDRYNVGKTLEERLAEAIQAEEYELAAKLRDQLRRRSAR